MAKKVIKNVNRISQYVLHYPANSKEVVIMLHGGSGVSNSYLLTDCLAERRPKR